MDANTKDKKGYKKYLVVLSVIVLLIGITYAVQTASSIFNATTATLGLDDVYGSTTFDASNLKFSPVLDSEVGTTDVENNVIKIDFTVGGASGNDTSKDIIYDIALVDLDVSCELLSPYVKWKLIKNGSTLASGSLDYKFDTIKNGRFVLTETQLDLPDYNASKTGYDNYTFYMWISDSCQSDLATCAANGNLHDQSSLLNKRLKGKIEVELYTSTKKTLVRNPSNTLDTSTCFMPRMLNSVEPGSYVAYTGNNGCSGNSCQGQNANYVSDTDLGYCDSSYYKFCVNGWRVGYISDGTAYLVSAGAPECIATDSSGNMINTGSNADSDLDSTNLYKHLNNLDNESLLYCNTSYAYGGVCDSTCTWAMDATDFQAITGSVLSSSSCFASLEDTSCGYGNDLIDNGGYYWYATQYSASSNRTFYWAPNARYVHSYASNHAHGLRPVLRLQSSVQVVAGSGTYEAPYTIASTN